MTSTIPSFAILKARQRSLRDDWPQPFALRIHRGISWIARAEQEIGDHAGAFLFYWISFNAAYGGERSHFGTRGDFETFFYRLERFDTDSRLYDIVWHSFPGPIRLFLQNRYVFAPFWRYHNGENGNSDWEAKFAAAERRFHAALRDGETIIILSMLFDRLYVLRNQIMHGGSDLELRCQPRSTSRWSGNPAQHGAGHDRPDDGCAGSRLGCADLSGGGRMRRVCNEPQIRAQSYVKGEDMP